MALQASYNDRFNSFEPLLSTSEAAVLLNLHPVTLLRWAREGKLPHLRLGRKVMFRASELDAWCTAGYAIQKQRVN
ncbi:helix-turn-helix domain-containing protein [Tunturibacter empetritectus]